MCSVQSEYPWYVARVRTRFEKKTADLLEGKGFRTFLPQYRTKRVWSDRVVLTELALFPGYVFFQMDPAGRWLPVVATPGVISLVSINGAPAEVDRQEISSLMRVVGKGLAAEPWTYLEAGQRVLVEQGALAGMEGIFVQVKNRDRLIISVSLLQRSVAVEIERCWVRPLSPLRKPTTSQPAAALARVV